MSNDHLIWYNILEYKLGLLVLRLFLNLTKQKALSFWRANLRTYSMETETGQKTGPRTTGKICANEPV